MATWAQFEVEAPELAAAGRQLFYQFGVGLGFLATIRRDGGPRLHPICPIIAGGGLYTFLVRSPKFHDLRRDGPYALHAFLPEAVDDEFSVTGRATENTDPTIRVAVIAAYHTTVADDHVLFEFEIARCLYAKYRQRGDWPPTYTKWTEDGAQ